jgi:hypothetical protein
VHHRRRSHTLRGSWPVTRASGVKAGTWSWAVGVPIGRRSGRPSRTHPGGTHLGESRI